MQQQTKFSKKMLATLLLFSMLFVSICSANAQAAAYKSIPISTDSIRKAKPDLDKADKNGIYQVIEKMPQFPGGEKALLDFISHNLKYPIDAQEKGIQGRIVVRFVVTKTGKVENVEIVRALYPSLDKEGARVISSLPDWIPGEQKGEKVSVYYTLPITYRLDGNSKSQALDQAQKPLIILDDEIVAKDFSFATLNKDSISSVDVIRADKKEKLDELALKFGAKTDNGVIIITTKKYARLKASGKVQTVDAKLKELDDKDLDFNSFKAGEIPLFVIDGQVSTQKEASNLDKKEIQEITVLKNEAAISQYGEKAKSGVIILVSKTYARQMISGKGSSSDEKVWDVIEQMPLFPGGEGALMSYIGNNLRYPVEAQRKGIQGRVILRFVVASSGKTTKVEVVRSVDPALDKEAIRVVESLPYWTPGKQKGVNVNVYYTLPINFRLK